METPLINYTFQDVIGATMAFLLFSIVFVTPGYVIGWVFDLFAFKRRLPLARFVIGTVLSTALMPVILYLSQRLISIWLSWLLLAGFFIAFCLILYQGMRSERQQLSPGRKGIRRLALAVGGIWVVAAILLLVDIQIGQRLYFSVVALDYSTRVAIIDAITRSGVPPVNPGYFPGQPAPLTLIYYFWYIPASLVEQLGGDWVDARTAMIASAAWCGLATMATVALYLRLRHSPANPLSDARSKSGDSPDPDTHDTLPSCAGQVCIPNSPTPGSTARPYRKALTGIALLLVSGLDILPTLAWFYSSYTAFGVVRFDGDIEQWNNQIKDWVGAALWVPHHLASALACLVGLMLLLSLRKGDAHRRKALIAILAGLCFASALGLSVWVTLVFAAFWGVWLVVKLTDREQRSLAWIMLMTGLIAVIAASPFIFDVLQPGPVSSGAGGGGSASLQGLPVEFTVRSFYPMQIFVQQFPRPMQEFIYLLMLPVNYFFELGFFMLIGLVWFERRRRFGWQSNPWVNAEALLLATTVLVTSFFRSAIIPTNDLGWRGWMLGQFVLLVWAVDVIGLLWGNTRDHKSTPMEAKQLKQTKAFLLALLVVGLATTTVDMVWLRSWLITTDNQKSYYDNRLDPDGRLGERTFAARQAYEFIRDQLPKEVFIQYNPTVWLDRPSGLYGSRQVVISDHTRYGVSDAQFDPMVEAVSPIFENGHIPGWDYIDQICRENQIDIIVIRDVDPSWEGIQGLNKDRPPLYQNNHYAVYACGANIQP